jgi:cellulose synthase/poly-beta-1,6-N-acetylglucosamine synthase-like glycosyltransferase
MELIPMVMEQNYAPFEVIVINDNSWDDSADILKAFQVRYPGLHVTHLDEEKQRMQGKKFAITLGIKAAKYDRILLTDADCRPGGKEWISTMMNHSEKGIILAYSPFLKTPGLLNALIRFDAFQTALNYLGLAQAGMPYMGVGRNLSYTKDVFFKVGGFRSHIHLMSGDDDLFINQVANKGNTAICIHPDAHMTTAAKETFSDWLKQKRRHFSVAPKYKFSHRFLLFLFPACYWLMIISATLSLVFNTSLLLVITPLFLRYLVQFLIFRQSAKWLLNKDLSFLAWFYEALIMVFMPFVALWGMIAKPVTWR